MRGDGTWQAFPTIPTITDTYSGTSSDGMSGKAVKSAIDALDVTITGASASKTLTALSQTDGKITATFENISITKSQISNCPPLGTASAKDIPASGNASSTQVVMGNDTRLSDSRTPTSHTHGNIQNGGTLQTNDITIGSGDKLVVTDSSNSNKVARTSLSFGTGTSKYLREDGTWEVPPSGGNAIWGGITGTLSNQTDLQTVLDGKLDANPSGITLVNDAKTKRIYVGSANISYWEWNDYNHNWSPQWDYDATKGIPVYAPKVLWTNSSVSSSFAAQSIALSQDISNFTYYEIIYIWSASGSPLRCVSTGRIPTNRGAIISISTTRNYIRTSDAPSGTSLTFNAAQYYNTYGGSGTTTSNGNCVPYKVLGWKN